MILFSSSTMVTFAKQITNADRDIVFLEEEQLAQFAVENEENIVLMDENGYILNEFHSDGYAAEFIYAATLSDNSSHELVSIVDNDGKVQNIFYNVEGNIAHIDVYCDDEYVGTKDYTMSLPDKEIMSLPDNNIFFVTHSNGTQTNMSDLISNYCFRRHESSASQQDIQNLFDTTGSPLKNNITIYRRNSDGVVYNTGITVTPAKVIYDASVTYTISPKVILATLQKESSLVSSAYANEDMSSRIFYFCMGAGSSKSATSTGFENQINLGTSTLQKWYQEGIDNYSFPYYYSNQGFYGYRGYNTTGYVTSIWCENAATYSLYKYTPYTCGDNENTHTANVLFYDIYYGKMLANFPL